MPDLRRTSLIGWLRRVARLGAAPLLFGIAMAARADTPTDCPPVAQMLPPSQVQTLMHEARDHGFLWRITRDGHSSWLYGTIHVARVEWAFPGPDVLDALHASDTLALELDPSDPDIQRRLSAGIAAVRRPTMPEELAARLDLQSRAECIPAVPFDSMPPEVRIMVLTTLIGRRDGIDPAFGIDAFLSGFGHGSKMNVVSLETPELQLKALEMPTDADSLAMIDSTLDEMERGVARPQLVKLATVWADGDLEALSSYAAWCDCLTTALGRDLMKRTLDDRNPDLAASIEALHSNGKRVFAAVGSLHMAGPNGLPSLLAKRGFEVERIAYPP